jgi:glycosyltransferase involved in cell wall biosynthesis
MDRIVCHEQSFWARQNTPEALADAMHEAFIRDLPALGRQARETVAQRFSWKHVLERQFDLYREVIHKFPVHE